MEIKNQKPHFTAVDFFKNKNTKLLILFFFLLVSFIAGGLTHKAKMWQQTKFKITKILPAIYYNINSFFSESPPSMIIDIKFKNYEKLNKERLKSLERGFHFKGEYFPAKINFKNKVYKVKLRLKGDYLDHFKEDKWSFRVKVKGENSIMGMKKFSLHNPAARNNIGEWIFHKILKDEGLIGLKYEFVSVILNGKDIGLYAIEEHFDKITIESNNRKEGPIIKFAEDLFWKNKMKKFSEISNKDDYFISDINGYNEKVFREDSALNIYKKSLSLLKSYRDGELPFSKIFNEDLMAKFYALSELLGAHHGLYWNNLRFYYNPITSKLEPIGFDANAFRFLEMYNTKLKTSRLGIWDNESYYNWLNFEKNVQFFSKFIYYLDYYTKNDKINKLIKEYESSVDSLSKFFHHYNPYYDFSFDKFLLNKDKINELLYPSNPLICYADSIVNQDSILLYIGNSQELPVKILGYSIDNSEYSYNITENIPGKIIDRPMKFIKLKLKINKLEKSFKNIITNLNIICAINGIQDSIKVKCNFWNYLDIDPKKNLFSQSSNIELFNFIKDAKNKKIIIPKGTHLINQDIFIPDNYTVICGGGTKIILNNNSTIFSSSNFEFIGNESEPIIVTSLDSTGQGIFIKNSNYKSTFKHTFFNNLNNPFKNNWNLTGALTFYEADVDFNHCIFDKNFNGDDYLNIIRSNFEIINSKFININADAFDSDFSNGNIINSNFVNCGNDGIDISGSILTVRDVTMDGIKDKGLSAGENSQMIVNNFNITHSAIGVCSKDLSDIFVDNIDISDTQIGFTAFQKKPEFGPATIKINNVLLNNSEIPYLIEENSNCMVNNEIVKNTKKKVENMLYGIEFGEASN